MIPREHQKNYYMGWKSIVSDFPETFRDLRFTDPDCILAKNNCETVLVTMATVNQDFGKNQSKNMFEFLKFEHFQSNK